jgi:DNA primase small subunit
VENDVPARIEFGPVCNRAPKENKMVDFKPEERELVFDIDMTDYDDVRTCCSGADICRKCWPLMTVAIKVLDAGLRQDFGFKHLLWVYSGRRGVHCWISDERARKLSDIVRGSVAEYFAVVTGSGASRRVSSVSPMHPAVERAYKDVLEEYWTESYLPDQKILEDDSKLENVLNLIGDDNIKTELFARLANSNFDSVERWNIIKSRIESVKKGSKRLLAAIPKIILWHVYPRVDIEVSKHMNHLLKGPFCVHPKTGRVCVPMDPAKAELFDHEQVPTVIDLTTGKKTLEEAKTTFHSTFWDACNAENSEMLTLRTRKAQAANKNSLEF